MVENASSQEAHLAIYQLQLVRNIWQGSATLNPCYDDLKHMHHLVAFRSKNFEALLIMAHLTQPINLNLFQMRAFLSKAYAFERVCEYVI